MKSKMIQPITPKMARPKKFNAEKPMKNFPESLLPNSVYCLKTSKLHIEPTTVPKPPMLEPKNSASWKLVNLAINTVDGTLEMI